MNYCGTFFCKKKAAFSGKLTAKHGKAYDGTEVLACKNHIKDLAEVTAL